MSHRAAASGAVLVDGLSAQQFLATDGGWVPAGDLRPGDRVRTLTQGDQPVTRVFRSQQAARVPLPFWPVYLPVGTMDNDDPVELLPAQMVLMEADLAEDLFGEPCVMVPASALIGWNGIERVPPETTDIIHLQFESPQVVFAGRSLLLGCNGEGVRAANQFRSQGLLTLTAIEARQLVAGLIREGGTGVLPIAPQAARAGAYRA